MSNLERWMMVMAIKAKRSGKTPREVAIASKKTRRKVILTTGEVRS